VDLPTLDAVASRVALAVGPVLDTAPRVVEAGLVVAETEILMAAAAAVASTTDPIR
jgi:hypothetical protein